MAGGSKTWSGPLGACVRQLGQATARILVSKGSNGYCPQVLCLEALAGGGDGRRRRPGSRRGNGGGGSSSKLPLPWLESPRRAPPPRPAPFAQPAQPRGLGGGAGGPLRLAHRCGRGGYAANGGEYRRPKTAKGRPAQTCGPAASGRPRRAWPGGGGRQGGRTIGGGVVGGGEPAS